MLAHVVATSVVADTETPTLVAAYIDTPESWIQSTADARPLNGVHVAPSVQRYSPELVPANTEMKLPEETETTVFTFVSDPTAVHLDPPVADSWTPPAVAAYMMIEEGPPPPGRPMEQLVAASAASAQTMVDRVRLMSENHFGLWPLPERSLR